MTLIYDKNDSDEREEDALNFLQFFPKINLILYMEWNTSNARFHEK